MGINDDGALRIQGPIREKYPQMLWQCRSKNTSISNHIWMNVTKNDQKGTFYTILYFHTFVSTLIEILVDIINLFLNQRKV